MGEGPAHGPQGQLTAEGTTFVEFEYVADARSKGARTWGTRRSHGGVFRGLDNTMSY